MCVCVCGGGGGGGGGGGDKESVGGGGAKYVRFGEPMGIILTKKHKKTNKKNNNIPTLI